MSVIGSNILAGASGQGGGYNLTKSLRFRSSASAYLSRTPASASNQKTWTLSFWMKRGSDIGSAYSNIFSARTGASGTYTIAQFASDTIQFVDNGGMSLSTTQVFRDPSAWYHFVFAIDTTQATSSNRVKLYVNGIQITTFSTATYPSQNADLNVNSTATQLFGQNASSQYADYYLAEINHIDGQALTPSSFGQTDSATGVWQPIRYTGTYGTNGFYLPFTDTTSTTTISEDFSGNNNDWTSNNISLTSGSTYDSMTDVPTLTSATTANYCVANPLDKGSAFSISNGNLTIDINASKPVFASAKGTFGITSGKWYWECVKTSSGSGLSESGVWATDNLSLNTNSDLNGNLSSLNNIGMFGSTAAGDLIKTGLNSQDYSTLGTYTNGDVIGIAFDADNGKLYAYKNGTEFTGQTISSGTSILPTMATGKSYQPFVYSGNGGSGTETATTNINFGQRPFSYTPPTGFVALNTFNLPTPTIGATASTQANKYMDVSLYTGTGASQSITNSNSMQPDMVWIKSRSGAYDHNVFDSVRGIYKQLVPNATYAENNYTTSLTAFNSNGFSVGSDIGTNNNGSTFVGWQWRASNATAVTNTAGSITSTVSANTTAGFSVVTYTGSGSNATVGHGLGATPSWVIVKRRSNTGNWYVYSISTGNTNRLRLDETSASTAESAAWNNTSPTSTVFSIGTSVDVNASGNTFVAYCFAQVAGYSAFGSYTGNGSTDGPFVFTGFRPRFIMIKRSDSSDDWIMMDSSRSTYNVAILTLYANGSFAEDSNVTNRAEDFLSNGFKIRSSPSYLNASGGTYIYMAFAESPFKYSLGR